MEPWATCVLHAWATQVCMCIYVARFEQHHSPAASHPPHKVIRARPVFFSSSSSKRSFYSGLPHAAVKWQYRQTTEQQLKTTAENKVTKGCESSITADESNYFLTLKTTIDQVKNVEEDRVFSLVVTFTITGGNKYKVWQGNVFFFSPLLCTWMDWSWVTSGKCTKWVIFSETANWIWKVKCQKLAIKQFVGEWPVCLLYSTRPRREVTFSLGLRVNHNVKSEKSHCSSSCNKVTAHYVFKSKRQLGEVCKTGHLLELGVAKDLTFRFTSNLEGYDSINHDKSKIAIYYDSYICMYICPPLSCEDTSWLQSSIKPQNLVFSMTK